MKIIASLWLSLFFLSFEFDGPDATSVIVIPTTVNTSTISATTANTSTMSRTSSFSTNTSTMSVSMNISPTITVTTAINATASNTSAEPSRNSSLSTISSVKRTETIKSSPLSSNQRGISPHIMTALSPSTSFPLVSSTSTVSPGKPGGSDEDSEPKVTLYRWELVLICCGAFVFILFIIIGLLCCQNRMLKKKLTASRTYSLPIKENGAWIDNQDIPLWQKRASAFVSETAATSGEDAPTLTT